MIETGPDYKKDSRDELLDVLRNVDREKYPERAKAAEKALESLPVAESTQQRNDNKALTIFAIGSIEVVFWLVICLLSVAGYSIL